MLKLRKQLLAAGAGLFVLLVGTTVLVTRGLPGQGKNWGQAQQMPSTNLKIDVLPLASTSPAQRTVQLQAIAMGPKSLDRDRAHYLLANDLIQQKQSQKALSTLDGLEQDYPVLGPYVLLKRAQAYDALGATAQALESRQEVLKKYSKEPAAAEALFVLGRTEPKYWNQAIAQFPSHPRSREIALQQLKQNPHQPQLLLLLAKYAADQPGIVPILNQLESQYSTQLKPEDWETVASAYWENQIYSKAGEAYARSPHAPLNFYRAGRGFQLTGKRTEAIAAYQQLIQSFPSAKETGTALLRLAKMAPQSADAVPYLDQVINRFPNQAGEALVEKASILEALNSKQSALEDWQMLLTEYGDSDAAAEYRWRLALASAAAGDYQKARLWAQSVTIHNPKNILAPRAGFWFGKWAYRLGHQNDAKAAFEYVLGNYPQSYYAWRSAGILGLDVGNFNTVRQMAPQVVVPSTRPLPAAGSPTFRELYQLGQDRDAFMLWQAERNRVQPTVQPTVAEQYTDGLMHLSRGENLLGISQVEDLEDRETKEDQAQYQGISQQLSYWQARYPFPFLKEIEFWSQQRQLNPLLVTALARQESRFEPKIRSAAGAIGLMQMMPGTGQWVAKNINLKQYNLENPSDNVQMGTWFLDYTHKQYNDNSLLAVASYNAGPGNVTHWLGTLGKSDPDEFVEAIPFDETRNYVRQVFGNYWNYLRLYNPQISQLVAKYSATSPKSLPE